MTTLDRSDMLHYRDLRNDGTPARFALASVRARQRYATTLRRFGEWRFTPGDLDSFAQADMEASGFTIRVLVGNDDRPTDWGDLEPTDEERAATSSFYVAVQVLEGDAEVYMDGIGGVDAMDLPVSTVRDWEDAAGYALTEYLLPGAEAWAGEESTERAYWATRDVVTTP